MPMSLIICASDLSVELSRPPLQLSLGNPSYTIAILISIAELGSVALTVLGFKSDSETFFVS